MPDAGRNPHDGELLIHRAIQGRSQDGKKSKRNEANHGDGLVVAFLRAPPGLPVSSVYGDCEMKAIYRLVSVSSRIHATG